MKPTFQTGQPARQRDSSHPFSHQESKAPVTDWSFNSTVTALRGGSTPFRPSLKQLHPAFHTLSEGFFAAEARKESRLEGVLFAVIVALAAWPMVQAAEAAFALMK